MVKEIKNFERKDIFDHYHICNNPFIIVTFEVDITNIVHYCKKNGNFYATMGYLITKTANMIDSFKYRYSDNKFYYCERVKSNYTQMYDDGNIGYFSLNDIDDYKEYIKEYVSVQEKFLKDKNYNGGIILDDIWLSCVPWFSFKSLVPPYNKNVTIPQFIWDKYQKKNNKYFINLMVLVHHGFADGSHIAKFKNLLEKNIIEFNSREL